MSTISYAWTPITKSEEQDDGTIIVHGPAATSEIDRDRQRLDQTWLDEALPRWMSPAPSSGAAGAGGAVREQHDPKRAVGIGIGLSKADDGKHYLTARIVDPVAVKKIQHGVLKGFSVGIKNPRIEMGKADAPNGLVTAGDIVEVSVCDSPANGSCYFQMAKSDAGGELALVEDPQVVEKTEETTETFGLPAELYERLATPVKEALAGLAASGATVTAEAAKADAADDVPVVVNVSVQAPEAAKADLSAAGRRKAAASGAAMSDGSYPIQSKSDLRKAIRAVGRGGADHDKIRKHVIARAKALGLEAMVPDNWNADGSLKDSNKADADEELVAKAEEALRRVRALAPELVKADDGDAADDGDGSEAADISGADQAIAIIAKLIESEAQSLGEGNSNEACDIALLLDAVRALEWFKCREQAEDGDGQDGDMELSDKPTPETSAPATADGAEGGENEDADTNADEAKADVPTLTKADVTELIEAAVAKAESAAEERTKTLAADLAKAQQTIDELRALPQPGGPVLTRTTLQEAEARKSDATLLRVQAREFLAKADQCADRYLADGYREKAAELLAKADA